MCDRINAVRQQNNQDIAFIICTNSQLWFNECCRYIRSLKAPQGCSVEIIPIYHAVSATAGYNEGTQKSSARYKVYLHQDCMVLNENFIFDIIDIFSDKSVGLIGMVGCSGLNDTGMWWLGNGLKGRILQCDQQEFRLQDSEAIKQATAPYEDAVAVDGILLATQYDIPWREDIFDGWHFYDLSQCQEFLQRGLRVVIPYQENPWCLHFTNVRDFTEDFHRYRRKFVEYYLS